MYLRSTTYNSNRKLQNTHISHLHFFVVTAQRKVLSICVLQTTTVHTLSNQSYSLSLFRSMLCKFSFFPYFFAIIFFGLCKNGGHFLPGPQGRHPFQHFQGWPLFLKAFISAIKNQGLKNAISQFIKYRPEKLHHCCCFSRLCFCCPTVFD